MRLRVRGRHQVVRCPALQDRAPEQSLGTRHREQHADAHRPGRLPEDRDVARVTAERGDLLPHPLQRGHLVEQADVRDAVVQVQEALGTQAAS